MKATFMTPTGKAGGVLEDHAKHLGSNVYLNQRCVVDVDVPAGYHLSLTEVDNLPKAIFYHQSGSGRGIHALCSTEKEAALLSLSLQVRYPLYSVEHLRCFRLSTPLIPSANEDGIIELLRNYSMSAEDLGNFLAEREWKVGQRLPHSACPIAPTEEYDANPSVVVYADHLHCFRCNATRYFAQLAGHYTVDYITAAARAKVSFESALLEMRRFFGTQFDTRTLKGAYEQLCANLHGNYVANRCMVASGMYRTFTGHVTTCNFAPVKAEDAKSYYKRIAPYTHEYVETKKGWKMYAVQDLVLRAISAGKLSHYPIVRARKGVQICAFSPTAAGEHALYEHALGAQKMDINAAMMHLNLLAGEDLPWSHILTDIAAVGWTELGGPAPIILHHGVSGAGKTAAVLVAAAAIRNVAKISTPQLGISILSIAGEAVEQGTRINCLDEWLNSEYFNVRNLVELGSSEFTARILYKGAAVPIENCIAHILCGVNLPPELIASKQAIRRTVDPGYLSCAHEYQLRKILACDLLGATQTRVALDALVYFVRELLPATLEEAVEYSDFPNWIAVKGAEFPCAAPHAGIDNAEYTEVASTRIPALRKILAAAEKKTLSRYGEVYIIDRDNATALAALDDLANVSEISRASCVALNNAISETDVSALGARRIAVSLYNRGSQYLVKVFVLGEKKSQFLT